MRRALKARFLSAPSVRASGRFWASRRTATDGAQVGQHAVYTPPTHVFFSDVRITLPYPRRSAKLQMTRGRERQW